MLEILMAIALSLIVLAIGSAMAFQSLPVEKRLTRAASKLETVARKAFLSASLHQKDAYVIVHSGGVVDDSETIEFPDSTISVSRPGRFARFETPSAGGYRWKFGKNGLCEPLLIKITTLEGEVELTFDPLTGESRDQRLTVFPSR